MRHSSFVKMTIKMRKKLRREIKPAYDPLVNSKYPPDVVAKQVASGIASLITRYGSLVSFLRQL